MKFRPEFFDPASAGGRTTEGRETVSFTAGDQPEDTYVYDTDTILAVNVALATGRPLLVAGEPGCGKSTLAANVAAVLGWSYYKQVITSRIKATDLLWTFDALQRLNDANLPGETLREDHHYVKPGRLWWAYSPETAVHRGTVEIDDETRRARDPGEPAPASAAEHHNDKAVVLLDEIDKADPDVPNDLLEPLDRRRFTVTETDHEIVSTRDVMMILTTNGERELPPAFMRRCVTITLRPPDRDWCVGIADERYGPDSLHGSVADEIMRHREAADKAGVRRPSTGEYLDALEVCRHLGLSPADDAWRDVARSVIWKHDEPGPPEPAGAGDEGATEPG